MSERQKQSEFLKALILETDTEEHRRLREKIIEAERDERCVNRAMRIVAVVAVLAVCGIGYLAVLLPDFFEESSHILIRSCCALALGSLICFFVFLGLWIWHRALVNRALEEGRRCILAEHDRAGGTRPRPEPSPLLSVDHTPAPPPRGPTASARPHQAIVTRPPVTAPHSLGS
ncbi:MAG TPA: hypothetical protein VNO52_18075 [Methylomirabilota bacterium]|nr:hypothetical protein [Methylomirabilota bacterium]